MPPFPSTSSAPGHGIIVTGLLPPSVPTLSTLSYSYPLKLIAPHPTSRSKSLLVSLLTYGGGLVGGDSIHLRITVGSGSRLSLLTQGSTKIFKASPATSTAKDTTKPAAATASVTTQQHLDVTIEGDAALLYLPDHNQPYAESRYEQTQRFRLRDGARGSLCVLDWVSEGRAARGESWLLGRWSGRNEVWVRGGEPQRRGEGEECADEDDSTAVDGPRLPPQPAERLHLRDNLVLEEADLSRSSCSSGSGESLSSRMNGLGVFGTLILRGPLFEALGRFFVDEFRLLPRIGARDWSSSSSGRDGSTAASSSSSSAAVERWRAERQRAEKDDGLLWTAADVRGCVVVKFGARQVEGARCWVGSMIRREGSVEREFGERSLLCLR